MLAFSKSVHYDQRLYREDIAGSIAHAQMLSEIGIITPTEFRAIARGLEEIQREIEAGTFTWSDQREDVHMNIEAALSARVPAGAKLHSGRSRNDQVATDMRLWLRSTIDRQILNLRKLQSALLDVADRYAEVMIPGYTHLQRAQPILFAHHLLAYIEMLDRDAERLADARKRANVLPLGSGALAGSTLPLQRERVAELLGFPAVTRNSLDAVSDRDFIVEYLAAVALLGVHLSRLSEDFILWSSSEFNFIRLGDAFTTGSSLMPQKKNPDVAELTRGRSGRLIGNLITLLTVLKGLPMTYNRDLQEDKEALFDSADTIDLCLLVWTQMLPTVTVNISACTSAVADPLLLATDVADALVKVGIPFRHAHEIVGRAVSLAEKSGTPLSQLPPETWASLHPEAPRALHGVFEPRQALARRPMTGAPNPRTVARERARWRKILQKQLRS